jgi:hypothetical protein
MKVAIPALPPPGFRLEIVGEGGLELSADRGETPVAMAIGRLAAGVAVIWLEGTEVTFAVSVAGVRLGIVGEGGLMRKEMPEERPASVVTVMLKPPARAIRLAGTAAMSVVALM